MVWPSPWQPLAKLGRLGCEGSEYHGNLCKKKHPVSTHSQLRANPRRFWPVSPLPCNKTTCKFKKKGNSKWAKKHSATSGCEYKHSSTCVYIYICVYINMCVFFTYTHLKPGMMQGTRAVGKAPHGPKLQRPLSRIWQSARYKCNCVPSMSLGKKTSNTLSIQLTTVNATDNDSCFLCAYDNPQLRPCRT